MEYTINEVSKMTDLTTRTLRFYHQIHLLIPYKVLTNGYRFYNDDNIDKLQQILLYKNLDFSLNEIKNIVNSPNFNTLTSLKNHLNYLNQRKNNVELMIKSINKSIEAFENKIIDLKAHEKFEGFKREVFFENSKKYAAELTSNFNPRILEISNQILSNMNKEDYLYINEITNEIYDLLKQSVNNNTFSKKLFDLHKKFVIFYWGEENFSEQSHISLVENYVTDERFKRHYDDIISGGAVFLRDCVLHFYQNK